MIDTYNLINSKTIGNYCRKMKHQFNTLETSILIHRCKTISIDKKIEYYTEIINNPTLYPNKEIINYIHFDTDTNAIDLIKREIDIDYYNLDNKEIYLDAMSGYDGFEYYTEELKGFDRILKAISSLITNEIDLMLFLNAYNYLKAEDTAKEEIYNFGLFTDEGLRMAGLNRKDFDRKNKKL